MCVIVYLRWLCESPVAFVLIAPEDDLCLLEVKYPATWQEKSIGVPYLYEEKKLKKSSQYYTQVQMQLYVCNVKKCHFFVFSSVDYVLTEIDRDDDFL